MTIKKHASSMHNIAMRAITILVCLFFSLFVAPPALAETFTISDARAIFNQNKLAVDARLNLKLSDAVEEALHAGINLHISTQLDLFTVRPFRWDKQIARWEFGYTISYHLLTDRYLLKYQGLNQNRKSAQKSQANQSYSSLIDIFNALENFSFQSEILADTLPQSKHGYKLQLQTMLDKNKLPTPLRVLSYLRPAWRLKSKVHEWKVDSQ